MGDEKKNEEEAEIKNPADLRDEEYAKLHEEKAKEDGRA